VASDKALNIAAIMGGAELSNVGGYTLDLISTDSAIDLKDVLNQPATVFIQCRGSSEQPIHGYISRFGFVRTDAGVALYQAELVHWLWYLGLRVNSRIYQQVTVLDVLQKVFADYGPMADYTTRVFGSLPTVDYIVQFDESDLNFVSRLLEQYGLFYYFEHRPDGHTLVIADDSTHGQCCPPQARDAVVSYNPHGAQMRGVDCLTELSATRTLQPGVVALNTYDYKRPGNRPYVEVPTVADQGSAPRLEVYDGNPAFAYADRTAGEQEGRRRMETYEWQAKLFHGVSECRGLTVGHTFELAGHPWFATEAASDSEFLVVGLQLQAQNNFNEIAHTEQQTQAYVNHLTLIRKKIPFRPVRAHVKPVMPGPQTATVVGPKGQEIHTDSMGRIKVQFPWDRYGKNDQGSSCWIRVSQPWAGRGWGTVAVPRINQEVIVDFLNGDPDRPVIVGRLYNAEQTPPYALPEGAHRMGFHSNSTPGGGGFCELVIHDKKGEELVNIHSQKDMATTVQNNQATVVHGPHQTNTVTTGDQTNIVKKAITVQSQDEGISATAKQNIQLQSQEQMILALAKQDVQIATTDAAIVLEAKTSITLKVGKSVLQMNQDGSIVLEGVTITLDGSDCVALNP